MKFNPTPEQISAAETVFLTMAHLGVVKPIVDAYQREILGRNRWKPAPELADAVGQQGVDIILDPQHSYLLSDEDMSSYTRQCNEARIAAGLHVESPEYCPALVAGEDLRKAKRLLVDAFQPVTGLSADALLAHKIADYDRYVDLTLSLMAPFCNPQKRLAELCEGGDSAARPRQVA